MKRIIAAAMLAGTVTLALSATLSTPSQAREYRWCAVYGGPFIRSGTNCGFNTLAQCQATISGVGGSCEPNQNYTERRSRHTTTGSRY